MIAILYDPADADLIDFVHGFVTHILACPNCSAAIDTVTSRMMVAAVVEQLRPITTAPLSADDLEAVKAFCETWKDAHASVGLTVNWTGDDQSGH